MTNRRELAIVNWLFVIAAIIVLSGFLWALGWLWLYVLGYPTERLPPMGPLALEGIGVAVAAIGFIIFIAHDVYTSGKR